MGLRGHDLPKTSHIEAQPKEGADGAKNERESSKRYTKFHGLCGLVKVDPTIALPKSAALDINHFVVLSANGYDFPFSQTMGRNPWDQAET